MAENRSKYEYECHKRSRSRYKKTSYYGPTAGKFEPRPWEDNEERIIMFSKKTDRELSKILSRSVGAIQKQRWRIKEEGRPWLKNAKPVEKTTSARNIDTT